MELKRNYIRTDRNGTKYYEVTYQCCKCHGTGNLPHYAHYADGVCFDCDGSGVNVRTVKEYTKEYAAKLEAKHAAKQAAFVAEQEAKRAAWNPIDDLKKMGYNEVFYIVVDAKTGKPIERSDRRSSWLYFTAKCKNIWDLYFTDQGNIVIAANKADYQVVPMSWTDIFVPNRNAMVLGWNENILQTFLDKYYYGYPQVPISKAVGTVGERMNLDVTLKEIKSYDTFYGTKYFYTFQDRNFNLLRWETGKDLEMEVGTAVKLTGTITKHESDCYGTYTYVNRCKIA